MPRIDITNFEFLRIIIRTRRLYVQKCVRGTYWKYVIYVYEKHGWYCEWTARNVADSFRRNKSGNFLSPPLKTQFGEGTTNVLRGFKDRKNSKHIRDTSRWQLLPWRIAPWVRRLRWRRQRSSYRSACWCSRTLETSSVEGRRKLNSNDGQKFSMSFSKLFTFCVENKRIVFLSEPVSFTRTASSTLARRFVSSTV